MGGALFQVARAAQPATHAGRHLQPPPSASCAQPQPQPSPNPNPNPNQAITLEKLRSKEGGAQQAASSPRRLTLSREQQAALGHVFAPAVFDEAGGAVVIAGEAPGGAAAAALDRDNTAALDAQLDAIFVDSYEVGTALSDPLGEE